MTVLCPTYEELYQQVCLPLFAYLLKHWHFALDLGIPYRIIEAQGKVGGRLFTFKFQDKTGSPYNYFDIDAMRFPKISSMQRVFNLFDYPPLNMDGISLKTKVKPFYFVGGGNNNTLYSYNGVTVRQNAQIDPLRVATRMGKAGITLYVIACEPTLSQYYKRASDFYAGLVKKTRGKVVNLGDLSILSTLVAGSALEVADSEKYVTQYQETERW